MHQIEAKLKRLFKGKGKPKVVFGNDPREDWKKILISFLVINLLIVGWSAYLFWQINRGDIFQVASAPTAGADATTRANLKTIITIYDAKEKHFEDLRANKPATTDPAI